MEENDFLIHSNHQSNDVKSNVEESKDEEENQHSNSTDTVYIPVKPASNLDESKFMQPNPPQNFETEEPELVPPPNICSTTKRSVVPVTYRSNSSSCRTSEDMEDTQQSYADQSSHLHQSTDLVPSRNASSSKTNRSESFQSQQRPGGVRRPRSSIYAVIRNSISGSPRTPVPRCNRRLSTVAASLTTPMAALQQLGRGGQRRESNQSAEFENESDSVDPYNEGLDDNFRDTPWKPPVRELAEEDRRRAVFGGARAEFFGTSNIEFFVLGEGVGLYFIWLKYLMRFTAAATLFSVPALLMSYWGEGFESDDLDPLKLSLLSAGNHRDINPEYEETPTMRYCSDNGLSYINIFFFGGKSIACDEWFFRLWNGGGALLTAENGSLIIVLCDLIACLLLVYTWNRFEKRIVEYQVEGSGRSITTHSYSVLVDGLPEDATDEDIIEHFSELYRLDKQSWSRKGICGFIGRKKADLPDEVTDHLGRPCGRRMKAVESTRQSRFDSLCRGTWLAECSIVHPEGQFILAAKSIQNVSKEILELRSIIKMNRSAIATKTGPDMKKVEKAEKELGKLEETLKVWAQKLDERAGAEELEKYCWKCEAAFIIFNHQESFRRCLRDYEPYVRIFQPSVLKFKGQYPLTVTQAPAPGNIVWENIEVSKSHRLVKKILTGFLTALLLTITFIIIAWASRTKNNYQSNVASANVCEVSIPVSFGLSDQSGNNSLYRLLSVEEVMDEFGETCDPRETYIGLSSSPRSPSEADTCFQPCIDPRAAGYSAKHTCGGSESYSEEDVVSCYCKQELMKSINQLGVLNGAYAAISDLHSICYRMTFDFITGQLLLVVASVVVVVVNIALKVMLAKVVPFELHRSVTSEALSLAQKVTLALFVNTLLVTLLVNAYVPSDNYFYGNRGGAKDFDYEWYVTAGAAVSLTMTVNVFSSHGDILLLFFVLSPLRKAFTKFHSQLQMNEVFKGPQFNLATRLPFAISFISVCMVLSPALPILYFLSFCAISLTWILDRYMLLRFYSKPPQYDATLGRWANSFIPSLLILHSIVAIYVYGNSTIFKSGYILVSDANVGSFMERLRQRDILGFFERILKTNCFLFFVLLVGSIISSAFSLTVGRLGRLLLRTCACSGSQSKEFMTNFNYKPPYTAYFRKYIYPGKLATDGVNDLMEVNEGWNVRRDKDGVYVLMRKHTSGKRKGKIMQTWEVIKESGIHTYHMEDNPNYAYIIYTRNKIVEELKITTPKSPGGKLWSEKSYRNYAFAQNEKKMKLHTPHTPHTLLTIAESENKEMRSPPVEINVSSNESNEEVSKFSEFEDEFEDYSLAESDEMV